MRTDQGPAARGRVLIVIQNLPFRLDRRVRHECQALVEAGYRVSVICPKAGPEDPDHETVEGVEVHSYLPPPPTSGVAGYVREFAVCWLQTARLSLRVHRRQGFDVLQTCNPPDTYWLLARLWRLRTGARFVFDQHDLCPEVYEARFRGRGLLHRALLGLEQATYRTADHVICPNPLYREVAEERGGVPRDRTTVVMSSPDPAVMFRGEVRPELRRGRRHLVCYVGVMGPQDGVDHLLDLAEAYVHQLGRDDCTFALLGFGDCLEELKASATARGLDEWVSFPGRVEHDELRRWLSTADVGVTPDPPCEFNDRSTMNKTLEYMAHSVPVLATELRETRRCAGPAAAYVSGTDPLESARELAALLDDPDRRRAMGRVGRLRIERTLAWPDQARAYVAAIDGVLGRAVEREEPLVIQLPPGPGEVAAPRTTTGPAAGTERAAARAGAGGRR